MATEAEHLRALTVAARELAAAESRVASRMKARDAAVRAALNDRVSERKIAEATGLVRGRIYQIKRGRR